MTFLLDTTIRMSVPIAIALAGVLVLRRRSAATQHWLLAAAIACAAAMPLLETALPSWHIEIPRLSNSMPVRPQASSVTTTIAIAAQANPSGRDAGSTGAPATTRPGLRLSAIVLAVWISGALMTLSMLLVGLLRLSRVALTASCAGGRLAELAGEIARAIGLGRPVAVLQSDQPTVLVTWGLVRPKVVLPAAASQWTDERLRIVLRHELAHVRRGDWAAQMLAEVLRAVYWFNPLIWIACRRLRDASERACDDAVLNGGVEPANYASHLLDLARTFTAMRRAPAPALAMARSSKLEGRISAMLDSRLNRRPLTTRARVAIVATLFALTVPVAIAAQSQSSALRGVVTDQTNRVLPDVALTLSNLATQAKYEVRSDRSGHFEFAGLPSGEYELRAAQPGFALHIDRIPISGSDVTRDLQLKIGSVHETVTVSAAPAATVDPAMRERKRQEAIARAQQLRQEVTEKCASGGPAVDVGGNILAPMKVQDVRPVYPEQLRASNVSGVVTLDALIGTDGAVQDVKAVTSPNPDFERAAIDAVKQWEFTTTFLNCTPVEVQMRVTVNFVPGQR